MEMKMKWPFSYWVISKWKSGKNPQHYKIKSYRPKSLICFRQVFGYIIKDTILEQHLHPHGIIRSIQYPLMLEGSTSSQLLSSANDYLLAFEKKKNSNSSRI